MHRYTTAGRSCPGYPGDGGGGRSYGAPSGWGGGGWGGRRRRHLYGPVSLWRGLHGRGAAARRRQDRRLRRWRTAEDASREEHRDIERLREEESMRISEEEARKVRTLTVSNLDLHVEDNTQVHHTDDYACTTADPKQLVLRRGQEFTLTLTFDRRYDNRQDDLFFIFSPDDDAPGTPRPNSGDSHGPLDEVFQLDEDRTTPYPPNYPGWAARIVQSSGTTLVVRVHVAGTCVVGEWDLKIRTRLHGREGEGEGDDFDYDLPHSVIVLFNPWSPGDQVYFPENPEHLEEYVLNDSGLVFRRSNSPWFYGQFSDHMLTICLSVLRKAFGFRMTRDMGSAVTVARALSRIVNSQDDEGVLVGKWKGSYDGGIRPTAWDSSLEILRKFYNSGQPVKFGQCWVFSHVLTAVCRALGLPCRSVTNFDSAHDTDGTCTIDYYFAEDGEPLEDRKTDSVWNFHVWNEVWIMRPDLEGDFDGWHVIDATPQETSKGLYQCGPCPVKAVKRGEVEVGYDTRFVFGEVNADIVHWTRKRGGDFEVSNIVPDEVGRNVTTKHPTMDWQLDITNLYKYPEGNPAERAAVEKAVDEGGHGSTIYKDLEVRFEKDAGTAVGKDLEVTLLVRNTSREVRTVVPSMVARATHYWNHVHGSRVLAKKSYPQKSLRPGETLSLSLSVVFQQYHAVCDDLWTIRGFASVMDVSGGRSYTAERTFSLLTPALTVKGPERARSGQSVTVSISFTNPLPIALTNCSLHMNGSLQLAPDDPHAWSTQDGSLRMPVKRDSALRASEKVMLTVRLMGKWAARGEGRGKKSMVMSFECAQLGTMKGVYHLTKAA